MQFNQRSFVKTMTVTASPTPTALDLDEVLGIGGSFRIALYNSGSHGASIVFAADASAHSGYYIHQDVSVEIDGWTSGDAAAGLYLYASSNSECQVTIRWSV